MRAGTSAELEAVTAERDFFREKYAELMNEMEHMKGQLKESQRIIDKLRGKILDLEIEKSSLTPVKAPKQVESGGGSTDTSVTDPSSSDDDLTLKSCAENNVDLTDGAADIPVASDAPSPTKVEDVEDKGDIPEAGSSDSDELAEEEDDEDDEAVDIRANAARMLQWANYQTSQSRTPNTSVLQDDDESRASRAESVSRYDTPSKASVSDNAIVYSLPTSLDRRQMMMDDESSLGSSIAGSRHYPERSVGSWRSGMNSNYDPNDRASSGKMGKLFSKVRGIMDPKQESSSESESDSDESTDDSCN